MNEKTAFVLISLMCVMMTVMGLWYTTSHAHILTGEKLPHLLKALSYATHKVKEIQSLSNTLFYTADEEEISSLLKPLPYTTDEEEISSLPKLLPYTADEEEISSLPKPLPYTADEKKIDEDESEKKTSSLPKTLPYTTDEEKTPSLPKTLPYARDLREIDDIQKATWTANLYQYLQSLNKSISPQVNMVFGDSDHMDLVLNWIIAAHVRLDPPLHNIMVLSLDQPLCDFLESKKLPVACIAVPLKSFLKLKHKTWGQGVKCRTLVLRIINYWGYDVASYDSDAVLLRNPQPVYDRNPDVKLFAGSGIHPESLSKQWGFSLCGCVLCLRSHSSTDNFWIGIHNTKRNGDDQGVLNHVLHDLGIRWRKTTSVEDICSVQSGWQGYGPLNCMVFSQEDVCRGCCANALKHNYYILHPATKKYAEKKVGRLKNMKGWFLSDNWKGLSNSSGTIWLKSISTLIQS